MGNSFDNNARVHVCFIHNDLAMTQYIRLDHSGTHKKHENDWRNYLTRVYH